MSLTAKEFVIPSLVLRRLEQWPIKIRIVILYNVLMGFLSYTLVLFDFD